MDAEISQSDSGITVVVYYESKHSVCPCGNDFLYNFLIVEEYADLRTLHVNFKVMPNTQRC